MNMLKIHDMGAYIYYVWRKTSGVTSWYYIGQIVANPSLNNGFPVRRDYGHGFRFYVIERYYK